MILDIVGLQISVPEFILTIISFFLFMFLLNKFLFKPVLSFMDARKARIDEGLAEGKKAEAALEENKAQLAQELAQTGADARGVINAARSDAEKAKGEVLNAAHAEAEQLHKNVRERVKNEEKAEGRNMEKPPQKRSETGSLVVTKSYGTRQRPPINATGSGAIAGKENASTFAGRNEDTAPQKAAQVPPERIPELFRDKRVEEWRASSDESSGKRDGDSGQGGNGDEVDTDELNEELDDLNCIREDYSGEATGIGPEEIDLIIDLCNGKDIPTDKRLSLLRAIHHIKDTQIERSILESINGSDSRISKFLDEAEQMSEAAPDSD